MAKILVADDDATIRELLKKFLEERSHEVITAGNGIEALEKIREGPEIALLDIMMPRMDGLQVMDRIKKIAPATGVIIVTGLVEHLVGLECFRRGAFDFVTKPIDLKHLLDLIDFKLMHNSLEKDAEA